MKNALILLSTEQCIGLLNHCTSEVNTTQYVNYAGIKNNLK